MTHRSGDAIVVGGGVSGLTTALCLAEAGYSVRVWSADQAADTTSYAGGAIYSPFLLNDERASQWAEQTFTELEAMALQPGEDTGVAMVQGQEVSRGPAQAPDWATKVTGFRYCDGAELPRGFTTGWSYRVPLVDMPIYLQYLQTLFVAKHSGIVEQRRISTLDEPATEADVVANCTGMGARELVPDPALRPIRGELVVMSNPGIDRFLAEHSDADRELTYLLPHRDVVVLGGTADEQRWDVEPDDKAVAGIIARCTELEPRLRDAQVLGCRVGIRPARDRVRAERTSLNGAVVLHNYGHGGSGVSVSWGCARYVVGLLSSSEPSGDGPRR
ncbi:FAD-binding oxidoreductase [Actinoplanes sp. TRM 88003]|uniref:D-amino-acid oxidase n=1 Tax=Paractinoplanes aksuensis TaxID=2939490 RepID=A0ABT1DXA1_9ACTN|nr:FAD-dependent oxidoreductase [Actinoplanes aksuensis]MCO8275400.1 FAD-binding oxidoreductase [Actinoplanes aksuensis]